MMNDKAKEIGMTETHFDNPDGLPAEGEYTTAFDMVTSAHSLVRHHPEAIGYTSAKEFAFDKIKQPNFNTLLFYDKRVNGIKTGHVDEAGHHLVASARVREGMNLLSAVMGAPSAEKRRTDNRKLDRLGVSHLRLLPSRSEKDTARDDSGPRRRRRHGGDWSSRRGRLHAGARRREQGHGSIHPRCEIHRRASEPRYFSRTPRRSAQWQAASDNSESSRKPPSRALDSSDACVSAWAG